MKITSALIVVCLMLLAIPFVTSDAEAKSPIYVDFKVNDNGTTEILDYVISVDGDMSVKEVFLQVCRDNNLSYEIIEDSFLIQHHYPDHYVNSYCDEISSVGFNGTTFSKWSNDTVHCFWNIYITDNLIFDMDAQVRTNHRVTFDYVHATVTTDPDIDAEIISYKEQEEWISPEQRLISSLNDENNELKFMMKSLTTATIFLGIGAIFCWFMWARESTINNDLKHKIHELESKGGE